MKLGKKEQEGNEKRWKDGGYGTNCAISSSCRRFGTKQKSRHDYSSQVPFFTLNEVNNTQFYTHTHTDVHTHTDLNLPFFPPILSFLSCNFVYFSSARFPRSVFSFLYRFVPLSPLPYACFGFFHFYSLRFYHFL